MTDSLVRLKAELRERGIQHRSFAVDVGVSPGVFGLVVNGHQRAWPALRHRISETLGLPEAELFPPPKETT